MKRHGGTPLNARCQVKTSRLKGYTVYDSSYRTFWKRQDCGDDRKISGLRVVTGQGWIRSMRRIFRAVKIPCVPL